MAVTQHPHVKCHSSPDLFGSNNHAVLATRMFSVFVAPAHQLLFNIHVFLVIPVNIGIFLTLAWCPTPPTRRVGHFHTTAGLIRATTRNCAMMPQSYGMRCSTWPTFARLHPWKWREILILPSLTCTVGSAAGKQRHRKRSQKAESLCNPHSL